MRQRHPGLRPFRRRQITAQQRQQAWQQALHIRHAAIRIALVPNNGLTPHQRCHAARP